MKHIDPKYVSYRVLIFFSDKTVNSNKYEVYYLRNNSIPHFYYDILTRNARAKFNQKIVAFI